MEVSRFNGLVAKPMSVEHWVARVVSMRKPLKRPNCAECGLSTGLKAGVNEKNAGTSLPDARSRLAKRSSQPIRLRSGQAFARYAVAMTKSLLLRDFQ
jgi:hypothetical protein